MLFVGLTLFRLNISRGFLSLIHRVSGVLIVAFGVTVLLSLSPLKQALNITF
jgi:succinate dehydrogenase/fumarate reductase cytochrome b subunit